MGKLIKNYSVYLIILTLTLFLFLGEGNNETEVLFTFLTIVVISLLLMYFGDPYPFSLNKIFMLFSFFFFGIAPLLQYKNGVVLWRVGSFSAEDYYNQNLLIIAIIISYFVFYTLFNKVNFYGKVNIKRRKMNEKEFNISNVYILVLSLLSSFIILFYNDFDIHSLIFRSTMTDESASKAIYLIITKFIYPIPIICLIIFKLKSKKKILLELILGLLVLLTNFPTANARFYVAAVYIPLVIVYFKSFFRENMKFNHLLLTSLLLVFPFLNQFRRISSLKDINFKFDFDMFLEGHFDTYQMFMRVIKYDIVTNGKQFLSTILFFVPRSIWPEKSIGSGAYVANYLNLSFSNVSMNYFGEGYINYGYFGIVIFIIILALINSLADKCFWQCYKLNRLHWFGICYLFALGLEMFILRGSLLSAFAYSVGIFVSVFFVIYFYKVIRINPKLKRGRKNENL